MLFGYIRVSTVSQEKNSSIENQREELVKKGIPKENIRVETFHGERPVLKELQEELRRGDTLYVVRLDRLGINLAELVEFVNTLKQKGVHFVSLDMPETQDPSLQMLFLSVFGWLAEFETNRRRERRREGIAKAKRDPNKNPGRKTVITPEMKKQILEDLSVERPITRIAKRLGVSRSTVYAALKQIKEEGSNHTKQVETTGR